MFCTTSTLGYTITKQSKIIENDGTQIAHLYDFDELRCMSAARLDFAWPYCSFPISS